MQMPGWSKQQCQTAKWYRTRTAGFSTVRYAKSSRRARSGARTWDMEGWAISCVLRYACLFCRNPYMYLYSYFCRVRIICRRISVTRGTGRVEHGSSCSLMSFMSRSCRRNPNSERFHRVNACARAGNKRHIYPTRLQASFIFAVDGVCSSVCKLSAGKRNVQYQAGRRSFGTSSVSTARGEHQRNNRNFDVVASFALHYPATSTRNTYLHAFYISGEALSSCPV